MLIKNGKSKSEVSVKILPRMILIGDAFLDLIYLFISYVEQGKNSNAGIA